MIIGQKGIERLFFKIPQILDKNILKYPRLLLKKYYRKGSTVIGLNIFLKNLGLLVRLLLTKKVKF